MNNHGINWSDGGRGNWNYSIGSFDRMSMDEARSILQAARATLADQAVGIVLTKDQGEKYGGLLDLCSDAVRDLKSAPPQKPVSDEV